MAEQGGFIMAGDADEDEPVTLEFSDGARSVPGWIVSHYGGPEKLRADAALFAQVRHEDFIASFNEAVERERLNTMMSGFIGTHLGRLRK